MKSEKELLEQIGKQIDKDIQKMNSITCQCTHCRNKIEELKHRIKIYKSILVWK